MPSERERENESTHEHIYVAYVTYGVHKRRGKGKLTVLSPSLPHTRITSPPFSEASVPTCRDTCELMGYEAFLSLSVVKVETNYEVPMEAGTISTQEEVYLHMYIYNVYIYCMWVTCTLQLYTHGIVDRPSCDSQSHHGTTSANLNIPRISFLLQCPRAGTLTLSLDKTVIRMYICRCTLCTAK